MKNIRHPKYILLKNINGNNCFFSENNPTDDPRLSATGDVWYEIIGHANSVEEAQLKLYGGPYNDAA